MHFDFLTTGILYTMSGHIHLSHYLTAFDLVTYSESEVTASEVNSSVKKIAYVTILTQFSFHSKRNPLTGIIEVRWCCMQ